MIFDTSNTFVTSDHHFGHRNIIYYCGRDKSLADTVGKLIDHDPDAALQMMDSVMIKTWNDTVPEDATVIYLGDFALCKKQRKEEILGQLNGKKSMMILGNHDSGPRSCKSIGFENVFRSATLVVAGWPLKRLCVVHDPNAVLIESIASKLLGAGQKAHKGGRNSPRNGVEPLDGVICGHVHGLWSEKKTNGVQFINIGVDLNGFKPYKLVDVLDKFGLGRPEQVDIRGTIHIEQ